MPTEVDKFVIANDNAGDYANHLIEELNQKALEEIDDLFTSVDGRDPELWETFEVDPALVVNDYEQVEIDDRDLEWSLGFAGLSAAATSQFFLDEAETTIVKPLAYREQVLDGFELTQSQLIAAGKRQFESDAAEYFVKIQAKYLDEVSFLAEMEPTALYKQLLRYDAIMPADKQIADAMGYVARMTNYPPDSAQFKAEVARLIDRNSGDVLKQHNRRAVQRIYSFREAGGSMDALMVWLLESSKPCDFCIANAGEVKTYGEWLDSGMPGPEVCAGANRCHCQLHAVARLAA
jgi:hypothetical protein